MQKVQRIIDSKRIYVPSQLKHILIKLCIPAFRHAYLLDTRCLPLMNMHETTKELKQRLKDNKGKGKKR
jgi:hypothetical protein